MGILLMVFFVCDFSMKSFQCLETKLNIKNRIKCGNTIEWAANIASTIEKRNEDIILVINNIDGPGMRLVFIFQI